jgi:hypothetical protein
MSRDHGGATIASFPTTLLERARRELLRAAQESRQRERSIQRRSPEQGGLSKLRFGEWKPDGAPMDSFSAMHKGQMRMVGGPDRHECRRLQCDL